MVHVRAVLAGADVVKVIHDRPEAALLPSRRRFALARLIAFVRASVAHVAPLPAGAHVTFTIDRDQDAAEMYAVAIWYTLTTAVYATALLPLPLPLAIIGSILLTPWLVEIPFHISGGLFPATRNRDNRALNSIWMMSLTTLASAYVATLPSPARYVAWFFFAVLALNAIAFVIMWLLRARVRKLEARCGA
jgi:hypothetical protein